MRWNPHDPIMLGPEFFARVPPGVGPSAQVSGPAWAIGQTMPALTTESIVEVGAHLNGQLTNWAVLAEIINAGSEVPTGKGTAIFRPNGSANITPGGWVSTEGTFINAVNGTSVNLAKYLSLSNALSVTKAGSFDVEFATAGALPGKRILDVRLCMVLGVWTVSAFTSQPSMNLSVKGNTRSWGSSQQPAGDANGTVLTVQSSLSSGEIDRSTLQPWTVASVQAMDTSAYRFNLYSVMPANPYGLNPVQYRIYQLWIEVDYCDENRQATQIVTGLNTSPAWIKWAPRTPTGSSGWAKVAGTEWTFLLRQPQLGNIGHFAYSLVLSVPYLRGFQNVPVPDLAFYPGVSVDGAGTVTSLGAEEPANVIGVYVASSGPSQSADSQPVSEVLSIEVAGTVEQDITSSTAFGVDAFAFPVVYEGAPDDLTVELRRRSDNALMGTGSASTEDWDAAPADPEFGTWRVLQIDMSPVSLAVATTYYVTFSTGGPGSWFVQGLNTRTLSGVGTYDDAAGRATYDGGAVPETDLAVLVFAKSSPPAHVAAVPVGC